MEGRGKGDSYTSYLQNSKRPLGFSQSPNCTIRIRPLLYDYYTLIYDWHLRRFLECLKFNFRHKQQQYNYSKILNKLVIKYSVFTNINGCPKGSIRGSNWLRAIAHECHRPTLNYRNKQFKCAWWSAAAIWINRSSSICAELATYGRDTLATPTRCDGGARGSRQISV